MSTEENEQNITAPYDPHSAHGTSMFNIIICECCVYNMIESISSM